MCMCVCVCVCVSVFASVSCCTGAADPVVADGVGEYSPTPSGESRLCACDGEREGEGERACLRAATLAPPPPPASTCISFGGGAGCGGSGGEDGAGGADEQEGGEGSTPRLYSLDKSLDIFISTYQKISKVSNTSKYPYTHV